MEKTNKTNKQKTIKKREKTEKTEETTNRKVVFLGVSAPGILMAGFFVARQIMGNIEQKHGLIFFYIKTKNEKSEQIEKKREKQQKNREQIKQRRKNEQNEKNKKMGEKKGGHN